MKAAKESRRYSPIRIYDDVYSYKLAWRVRGVGVIERADEGSEIFCRSIISVSKDMDLCISFLFHLMPLVSHSSTHCKLFNVRHYGQMYTVSAYLSAQNRPTVPR